MLLTLFLAACALAQTASSHFSRMQDTAPGASCDQHIPSALIPIIAAEEMKSIFVIYEDEKDPCLYTLIDNLGHGIKVQIMRQDIFADQLTSVIDNLVNDENPDTMKKNLNFVLLCNNKCIQQSLDTGMELDIKVGKRSVLRHFSKWILIPNDDTGFYVTNLTMDNVIILTHDKVPGFHNLTPATFKKILLTQFRQGTPRKMNSTPDNNQQFHLRK